MNGLPGRLTERHLKMAEERGDNYIFYKGVNYTLKELYDGAGISRTKPKPQTRKVVRSEGSNNSDGVEPEFSSDSRKESAS